MDFTHFSAGTDDGGRRLDKIVRRFMPEESLSSLYKYIRKGLVKLNGKKCAGNTRTEAGDDIQIASFLVKRIEIAAPKKDSFPRPAALPEQLVVLRTNDILFLNKPYDVPVHPASDGNAGAALSEIVQADYDFFHEKQESLSFRTGPLHRLDRKTTGLIAFSQSLAGAQWFSETLRDRSVEKVYLGIVQGTMEGTQHWRDTIQKNERIPANAFHTVSVHDGNGSGKHSETLASPVAYGICAGMNVTLVEFTIKTGRTHQIRSQCAFHGFPLLGDTAYAGARIDSAEYGYDFFLHAHRLAFRGDVLPGIPNEVTAPLPPNFKKMLDRILIKPGSRHIIQQI